MSPLPFLGRVSLRERAGQFPLTRYVPALGLEGMSAGVDNVRTDVFLSARLTGITRRYLHKLIEQYGDVQQLAKVEEPASYGDSPYGRAHVKDGALPVEIVDLPAEFRQSILSLLTSSLRRAHANHNLQLDLLCRMALVKMLRSELPLQFTTVLEECRENLKRRDTHGLELQQMVLRDRFLRFQVSKRQVLRRVAEDVLQVLEAVERESLDPTRKSLFGEELAAAYRVLSVRILFPDLAGDPFFRAEHYALFGSFDRDPDLFERVAVLAKEFYKNLGVARGDLEAEAMLNVPENAKTLMFSGLADDSPRGRAQRAITAAWLSTLERAEVLEYVVAAYETVPILGEYGALVSPQQLKCALVQKAELRRVEELLAANGTRTPDKLHAAAHRVRSAGAMERMRSAARYLMDLSRFHCDLRRQEALENALDGLNLLNNEGLRELSKVNGTLYEFLLPEEEKPAGQRVSGHVILKADVRDSSFLTRSMLERGLNPASFFSLNFFEPVNRLLAIYGAEKVFLEGDAIILALLEQEGEPSFGVARTSILAGEMLNVVRAYNEASMEKGLPPLEIGIGIASQASAPLYLMDGSRRVMISDALNLSDRLSACNKRVRRLAGSPESGFRVFVYQTAEEAVAAGSPEDFLLHYNVGGIHLPRAAFEKLRTEISLRECELDLEMPWGLDRVRLFRGSVPLSSGVFRPLLIREGRAALVEGPELRFVRWSEHRYYEVCTGAELLARCERASS